MNQDNVKLALFISGVWGSLIIIGVAIEAVVHDGAIADTIVSTFGWVLGVLVAFIGLDVVTATPRFTFGIEFLIDGGSTAGLPGV